MCVYFSIVNPSRFIPSKLSQCGVELLTNSTIAEYLLAGIKKIWFCTMECLVYIAVDEFVWVALCAYVCEC